MTPDRITELAKQAGFPIDDAPITQPYVIQAPHYKLDDELKRFYALVRNEALEEAAERCEIASSTENQLDLATAIRSMKK